MKDILKAISALKAHDDLKEETSKKPYNRLYTQTDRPTGRFTRVTK